MPKNNNGTIIKSKARSKSTARKPLRDVSNAVKLSCKSTTAKISKIYQEKEQEALVGDENGALDRLLLIHSDISSLIHQVRGAMRDAPNELIQLYLLDYRSIVLFQFSSLRIACNLQIDELVVQALNLTSRKAIKEVESFANVLSEMQSSLKPWIARFQKALFDLSLGPEDQLQPSGAGSEIAPLNKTMNHVESPEQTTMDSLVSPSPLVSWRADCNIERSRQLFLLTPLPRPKELSLENEEKSKSVLKNVTSRKSILPPIILDVAGETNDNLLEGISVKPTPCKISDCHLESKRVSPENFSKMDSSMFVMTPCLKISPPKSCVLLEPISEFTKKGGHAVYKSTPYPVGVEISEGSEDSESSSSQVSDHTSVKYPDFLGIKLGQNYVSRRKAVEESPNWLMSPPKTCILMEPPDDKMLTNVHIDEPLQKAASILQKENNLLSQKGSDVQGDHFTKLAFKQAGLAPRSVMVEFTPAVKEPKSTIKKGKHPGENTLKKELWTKFEAASTNGIGFNVSVLPNTTQKGFLDRLDEAS